MVVGVGLEDFVGRTCCVFSFSVAFRFVVILLTSLLKSLRVIGKQLAFSFIVVIRALTKPRLYLPPFVARRGKYFLMSTPTVPSRIAYVAV